MDQIDDRVKAAVEAVSRYVNGMGHKPEEFVALMDREHRTLQQLFTGICVAWFRHLGEMHDKKFFDLRNEDSCKLGKRFVETFGSETYLRYI